MTLATFVVMSTMAIMLAAVLSPSMLPFACGGRRRWIEGPKVEIEATGRVVRHLNTSTRGYALSCIFQSDAVPIKKNRIRTLIIRCEI